MAAAQQVGTMLPPYGGVSLASDLPSSLRLRKPPVFYCLAESEPPFPTTPPGVLRMSDNPTDTDDLKPSTLPPPPESTTEPSAVMPEATKGDSYFAGAAREFRDALVELRETRAEISAGFRNQGADLHFIRHELQGFGQRLTTVESSTRDLRGEVADLKLTVRKALDRIEALEAELDRRKTSVAAPPAPSTGA